VAFGLNQAVSQDFFYLIFQAVYWHFVEVVWQFIFLILYCPCSLANNHFFMLTWLQGK
jgi:heme/copper-type cytochrome/quinol oxidase subunit 3